MADLRLYLVNPHYAPDSDYSEDAERLDRCGAEANEYFKNATADAKRIFNEKMADLAPCWKSPRYDRERATAKREYEKTSIPANELRVRTYRELFLTGEVSDATAEAWDALRDHPAQQEVARIFAEASIPFRVQQGRAQ